MGNNTLRDEHFVQVLNFPKYEVSNYGRVVHVVTGHDVTIYHRKNGDAYIEIYKNGKRTRKLLRHVVAEGFFFDYQPWIEVYLINGDKNDCSVLNITLTPPADAFRRIRIPELNEEFSTLTAAAKRIGGSAGVISNILSGTGHTHKGYTFVYVY